ncbi:MAG: multidrug efflux SMR transporter [Thermomicrobiales bacterium]
MTITWGWIYLIASGLVDIVWALSMKKADGFRNIPWALLSLVLLGLFVYLLTKALEVLPMGTAYAAWTGIGAVGSVIVGIIIFNEPASAARIACVALVASGVIGLRLTST